MGTIYDSVNDLKEMLFGEQHDNFENMRLKIEKNLESGQVDIPPQYLMMKVTNLCNSDCIYCNHAKSRAQTEVKEQIPLEQMIKIIDEAAKLGVKAISISGGEPLLRPDIENMVARIVEHGIVPVLLTNGCFLAERAEKLYESGLKYFIISLDSLDEKDYFYQRGVEINKVLEGIEALRKIKEKDENIKIHITPVVTAKNILQMPQLVEYFSELGIAVQFSPYHKFTYFQRDVLAEFDRKEVEEVIDKLVEQKKAGLMIANSVSFLKHFKKFMCEGKILPDEYECLAGFSTIYVDTYENVLPCWSGGFGPIGNLKQESLVDIWYSEKYAEIRKKMKKCQCPGCWLLCTGELTMLIQGEN